MKRVYFLWSLLLLLGLGQEAWAQQDAALVLTSARGEQFLAMIDSRRINPSPANQISVGRIPPGEHVLALQVLRRGANQIIKAKINLEAGLEANFELVPGRRRGDLLLRRLEDQPLYSRSSSASPTPERAVAPVPPPVPAPAATPAPAPAATPAISPVEEPTEEGPACQEAMRVAEVDKVLQEMRGVAESEQRYSIARSAVRSAGKIMADDLALLMKEIPSDQYRLHLAKFGYLYVCDHQFFDRVYATFDQKESADELQKFVASQR